MRRRSLDGAHFPKRDRNTSLRDLPSSFCTGKAGTDHNNRRLFAQGRWIRELSSTLSITIKHGCV
jgi:hypothetical protein